MKKKWHVVYKLEIYGTAKITAETDLAAKAEVLNETNIDKLCDKASMIKLGVINVTEAISDWDKFTRH